MESAVIFFHSNAINIYPKYWLIKCAESIRLQTYTNFDIYEVDYGDSNFSMLDLVPSLAKNRKYMYWSIKLETHAHAMYFILDKVFHDKYNYAFITNVDDYYHPQRIEKQLKEFKQGAYVVSCYWWYIKEAKSCTSFIAKSIQSPTIQDFNKDGETQDIITKRMDGSYFLNNNDPNEELSVDDFLFTDHNPVCHSGAAISKTVWASYTSNIKLLRYHDDIPVEDMTFWQRIRQAGYKIKIVPDKLVYYRLHPGQVGASKPRKIYPNNITRIAFLVIATGKYKEYLYNLVHGIFDNLFKNDYRQIFIFSDQEPEILIKEYGDAIRYIYIPWSGFPTDTLYRYHYFLYAESELLLSSDLCYYIDVDFKIYPGDDDSQLLPTINKPLIGVKHPGYYGIYPFSNKNGTPETRIFSTAYIEPNLDVDYICGGVQGGITYYFIQMSKIISQAIDKDDKNDIIAIHNDESHFNKFYSSHQHLFTILDPHIWAWPEEIEGDKNVRMVALYKNHEDIRSCDLKKASIALEGGLGNKLFQISALCYISKKLNREAILDIEPSLQDSRPYTFRRDIFPTIRRTKITEFLIPVKEDPHNTCLFVLPDIEESENICLHGWFQSYKYLEAIKDIPIFRSEYYLLAKKRFEVINNLFPGKTVSLHVRRGDYLLHPDYHVNLNTSYYRKAISFFTNETIVIFSDDIEWCKTELSFMDLPKVFFVDPQDEITEMIMMSLCDNHIIANSTYSWWGAWLGKGRVIAPKKWFGPLVDKPIDDLYPPHWETI